MFQKIMNQRNQNGFTLVELIVVIAILGILASIAVPKMSGFKESAQIAADKATAATLGKAAELYDLINEEGKIVDDENIIQTLIDAKLIEDGNYEEFIITVGESSYTVSKDGKIYYPTYSANKSEQNPQN